MERDHTQTSGAAEERIEAVACPGLGTSSSQRAQLYNFLVSLGNPSSLDIYLFVFMFISAQERSFAWERGGLLLPFSLVLSPCLVFFIRWFIIMQNTELSLNSSTGHS
jgi:hypothetical protein